MSPLQLSKRELESHGWTVGIVERWNAHAKIRQDLFGFADLMAFRGPEVALIQCTTHENVLARTKKLLANPTARRWCSHSSRDLEVHGWRKPSRRWECVRTIFSPTGALHRATQLEWSEWSDAQ